MAIHKKNTISKDTLYQEGKGPHPFTFDHAVTQVFDDMIHRSIPNYAHNLQTIIALAKKYSRPNTVLFDLGCSLGKLSIALSQANLGFKKIIAMDNSPAMISAANAQIKQYTLSTPIQLKQSNLDKQTTHQTISNTPSSVVILNYTLQFLRPNIRLPLLQSIHKSLVASGGGILILCEKICPKSRQAQHLLDSLYYDFKRRQGYHHLEISRKREALEEVLIGDSIHQHQARLEQAGFHSYEIWHKQWHFTSWIAWVS